MKLSNDTIDKLANFATINSNLVLNAGNTIKTISEANNIMAKAEVTENFPCQFGIYDLNEFLGAVKLVENAEVKLTEKTAAMSNDDTAVKYHSADVELLTTPTKDLQMPDADVELTISEKTLNKVRKAAATLGHSVMSIKAEDGNVCVEVIDQDSSSANVFSLDVGECEESVKADCRFLISNLKVVKGDYVVKVSEQLISEWSHVNSKLTYWIALEETSSFE
jgi:hypothetical protein